MLVNSIREASSPLRIAGGFLGIYLFDYEKLYFNHLYMLAIWTFYACTIVRMEMFYLEGGQYASIVGISILHASWVITLVMTFFNTNYKKTSEKCFKALCIVDDTLKSLGVSSEYRTIYRDSLITLTLLLVLSVGATAFTSITTGHFYSMQNVLGAIMMFACPFWLTNISDFNYWIVLRAIASRFDRLNQYVNDLSADRENHGQNFSKNTCFILKSRRNDNSGNDQSKVWIIMKLHRQLNQTSRKINQMFGMEFGLQLGVYFFTTIETISSLYLIYIESNKITAKKALLLISIFTVHLLHFLKIVLINCACETIQRKSNGMEAVLTNFINTVHDFESCQDVNQFLMQVKYRPLQFTSLGFISLGNKCLAAMFTSMAEIIIIMIQLGGISHASYVRPRHNTTTND